MAIDEINKKLLCSCLQRIDWRRVWETIQKDIPSLKLKVEKILLQIQ